MVSLPAAEAENGSWNFCRSLVIIGDWVTESYFCELYIQPFVMTITVDEDNSCVFKGFLGALPCVSVLCNLLYQKNKRVLGWIAGVPHVCSLFDSDVNKPAWISERGAIPTPWWWWCINILRKIEPSSSITGLRSFIIEAKPFIKLSSASHFTTDQDNRHLFVRSARYRFQNI